MKFKIASILELVVPLSFLVVLLLSACGGGSSYGGGKNAYDGTWNATMVMSAPGKGGTSDVVCAGPSPTPLTLTHGFGHVDAVTSCKYGYKMLSASDVSWADYTIAIDVSVTYAGLASQSAVVYVDSSGGARLIGTCDTPNSCRADPAFYMYR